MSVDVTPSAPAALQGGCTFLEGAVICAPRGTRYRTIEFCPTCKRRRRMVVALYVWHDPDMYCCACGDSFSYEWRYPRPAEKGWRTKAVARHRAMYAEAVTHRQARAAINAEVALYMNDGED